MSLAGNTAEKSLLYLSLGRGIRCQAVTFFIEKSLFWLFHGLCSTLQSRIVYVMTLRFCLLTQTYFTLFTHTKQQMISTHIPENLLYQGTRPVPVSTEPLG